MGAMISRASSSEVDEAFGFVQEYYAAVRVQVREDLDEFGEQYFSQDAGVWLARVDGEVVGCVGMRRLRDCPGCAEIKRMYLRAPYRGQGIADSLLDALEDYARAAGYRWLYLDTAADMAAAARFYERRGFVRCEPYNENPQAAIFMRKELH